jgi:hypothetical protein
VNNERPTNRFIAEDLWDMSLIHLATLSLIVSVLVVALTAPTMARAGGCDNDMDCKGDRICERGACVAPPTTTCGADVDCPGEQICENGVCIDEGGTSTGVTPASSGRTYDDNKYYTPSGSGRGAPSAGDSLVIESITDPTEEMAVDRLKSICGHGLEITFDFEFVESDDAWLIVFKETKDRIGLVMLDNTDQVSVRRRGKEFNISPALASRTPHSARIVLHDKLIDVEINGEEVAVNVETDSYTPDECIRIHELNLQSGVRITNFEIVELE